MVKYLGATLLCLFASAALLRAAPLPVGAPMTAAAQDRSGTIWALGGNPNEGKLYRQQGKAWQEETLPETAGFVARVLTRGDDGAVYVFWQTQETPARSLVTIHRGAGSRVLAQLVAPVVGTWPANGPPSLWAGAGGDVWITGSFPVLYHITARGDVTPFPIKSEQCVGGRLPGNFPSEKLSSVTDGQGRRWFWQSAEHGSWMWGGLRGFLVWDGNALAYHATLPDFPEAPGPPAGHPVNLFLTLAPLDAHHLWLSVQGLPPFLPSRGGLYRLDTRTLASTLVAPPEKGAFQNVTQVFRANGDWYVVETPEQGRGTPLLWRSQRERWQKSVTHLEEPGGYYAPESHHPWRAEPQGVWLGVQAGLWWIPKNYAPSVWVDWQRGLNVSGPSMSSGLADLPLSPPPLLPPRSGVVTGAMGGPKGLARLIADPRRHLWGGRSYWTGSFPLDEWDGLRWRTHRPPKNFSSVTGLYACDSESRIWLNTQTWNPPAQPAPVYGIAIYDPQQDVWVNYGSLQDALSASASHPGLKLLPNHNSGNLPLFSGDGRITYADNMEVLLYDGHTWRHWKARDILPGYPYGNLPYPPHFGADGLLGIVLEDQLWEWTPAGGWQQAGKQKPEKYVDPVPPGGPRGLWAVPAVDSQGEKWFVWQGAVYTAAQGLWVKQDALSGPGSPFWDGRNLEDVLRDPAGRLFFVTRPNGFYDFVVWSPPNPGGPPAPRLRVTPLAADSVALHFVAQGHGPHWFLWRLNGGEWSAPQRADSVTLSDLAHGDYRVEAQTLDARLQASARPSAAVFTIRVATAPQVAQWVQTLLTGSDEAREAAVRGLVKQTDLALPALQAARAGASENARWWIDAALQQIEASPRPK